MKKFFAMVLHNLVSLSKEKRWLAESVRRQRKEGGKGRTPRRAAKVKGWGLRSCILSDAATPVRLRSGTVRLRGVGLPSAAVLQGLHNRVGVSLERLGGNAGLTHSPPVTRSLAGPHSLSLCGRRGEVTERAVPQRRPAEPSSHRAAMRNYRRAQKS
ncbi:hypothetical protein SKAU_G00335730 [Synaphobranchus kaupii]|uniref:Uncharacterized protein n=1 Tax=Synaphobranchus kaupii TaxID=118154 RepID=A0A9Q1IIP2_SYNKA|nr:hypothetical protein SKAU_G00335730 [Synaphobranchus kaupii]